MIYEVQVVRYTSERATIKVEAINEDDAEDMVTRLLGAGQLEGEDWEIIDLSDYDYEEVDLTITESWGEPDFVREDILLD